MKRELILLDAVTGEKIPACMELSQPEALDGGEYVCIVSIPGLLTNPRRIYGLDGIQSFQLAIEFADHLLKSSKKTVQWPTGEAYF